MTEAGNRMGEWRGLRTQEFTGGFKPREMSNYPDLSVHPNEDNDGLSHHGRETKEDEESREQENSQKRRDKALQELIPGLKHISITTDYTPNTNLDSNPMIEGENKLLESGLGVDLGANGLSISAGANRGTVRSDTPFVTYGHPSRGMVRTSHERITSDLLKGRRKYKGRKYEEDDESDEDERKSKAKRRRKRKRGRRTRFTAKGGRQIKGTTKRRKANVARKLDRHSKRQSFAPNSRSLSLRRIGGTDPTAIPLRIRDPVAYQRKLANEKMRRLTGALPRAITRHRSSGETGITESGTRGYQIGQTTPTSLGGTQMPTSPKLGTSMRSGAAADAAVMALLGQGSDLLRSEDILKAKRSLSRSELIALKKKVEAMMRKLEKLTKSNPELGNEAKRGGQASPDRASAPTGATDIREEEKAPWMFEDTSLALGIVGKR